MSNVALACPAIRMVVVVDCIYVGDDGEPEAGFDIWPVLAIRTMLDLDEGRESNNVIVWNPEIGGPMSIDESERDTHKFISIAVCAWPPDEDEIRLAEKTARATTTAALRIKPTALEAR